MVDLFDIIKANNLIGEFTPEELKNLIENGSTENYTIMLVSKNRIIIKDNNSNTLGKLECVHNYFDLGMTDCNTIKEHLACGSCANCKNCFQECIKRLEQGSLSKK